MVGAVLVGLVAVAGGLARTRLDPPEQLGSGRTDADTGIVSDVPPGPLQEVLWRTRADDSTPGFSGPLAAVDLGEDLLGAVVGGRLLAVDLAAGRVVASYPALGVDSARRAVLSLGELVEVDPATGEVRHRVPVAEGDAATPAVTLADDWLAVGATVRRIGADGVVAWEWEAEQGPATLLHRDDERVVIDADRAVRVLDATTGALLATRPYPQIGEVGPSATVVDGTLVVALPAIGVQVLDDAGRTVETLDQARLVGTEDGQLVLLGQGGSVLRLDPATGVLDGPPVVPGGPEQDFRPDAAADLVAGEVVLADGDGDLLRVGRNGAVLWERPAAARAVAAHGDVVIASVPGGLRVVSAIDGTDRLLVPATAEPGRLGPATTDAVLVDGAWRDLDSGDPTSTLGSANASARLRLPGTEDTVLVVDDGWIRAVSPDGQVQWSRRGRFVLGGDEDGLLLGDLDPPAAVVDPRTGVRTERIDTAVLPVARTAQGSLGLRVRGGSRLTSELIALDRDRGVTWSTELDELLRPEQVRVSGDRVVLGRTAALQVLDLGDGTPRTLPLPRASSGGIAVADGTVVVRLGADALGWVDLATGEVRVVPVGARVTAGPVLAGGVAVIGTADGEVVVAAPDRVIDGFDVPGLGAVADLLVADGAVVVDGGDVVVAVGEQGRAVRDPADADVVVPGLTE